MIFDSPNSNPEQPGQVWGQGERRGFSTFEIVVMILLAGILAALIVIAVQTHGISRTHAVASATPTASATKAPMEATPTAPGSQPSGTAQSGSAKNAQNAPEAVNIGVESGNTLSLIAWDLYPNLTEGCKSDREAYVDVAKAAFGPAMPDPSNPDLIIAGQVLFLPAVINVCGRAKTADLDRAAKRATERQAGNSGAETTELTPMKPGRVLPKAASLGTALGCATTVFAQIKSIILDRVSVKAPRANIVAFGSISEHGPPAKTLNG